MFNLLKAEFIKAKSLKSTWLLLLIGIAVTVGLSIVTILMLSQASNDSNFQSATQIDTHNIWAIVLSTVSPFQIVTGILAVLLITSEFNSGTIKSSVLSSPRRGRLFAAKSIFILALIALLSVISIILAFFAAWLSQSGQAGQPELWTTFTQNFLSGCLAPTLAVVLGGSIWIGLSWLLRNSTGAIFAGIGIFLLASSFAGLLGSSDIAVKIRELLPQNLFEQIAGVKDNFLPSLLTLALYAIITLLAGAFLFKKKDVL
jgi:hypothetical protein